MLQISLSTLRRRLADWGIPTDDYSCVSPRELDDVIKTIKQDHPNDGEVLMKGHLLARGMKVKMKDMRDSIHRVDHANTVERRSKVIKRRIYSVPHPNALWHCDSHHKLIRWRLVIHAAISPVS